MPGSENVSHPLAILRLRAEIFCSPGDRLRNTPAEGGVHEPHRIGSTAHRRRP